MTLTLYDEFAGCGGSSQGAASVPGVELILAANHDRVAIDSHRENFPGADHYLGDIRSIDLAKFPRADLFWASPSCPPFSSARGVRRDFDHDTQGVLFETEGDAEVADAKRGRLLMHEVIRYLEAMALRGEPVLAGVVENVTEARKWDMWQAWTSRIRECGPGYDVRVIAMNSMHARPVRTHRAPQSRDRLFVAYWLKSLEVAA
jgi:DNA (cytosine-5)-methyltransferase 1